MGTAYFNLSNSPLISLSWILTFLFTSVAAVYSLWISPDFFNLALVFSILFLWLYKHRRIPAEEVRREKWRFLSTAGTDYLAAALAGIAFFSKPPNVVLIGILVLFYLLRRNFIRALVIVLIFLLTAALFLGTNYLVTGDWNYQGGERKTFYGRGGYPLERPDLTFESARGDEMTSENYSDKHLLPPQFIAYNLYYYFAGRFTGVIWYFFPAFFCLILFIFSKKRLDGWLILAALTAEILIYILLMPDNYSGGGGTLANRYFLSIYPLFLFLPQPERKPWQVGLCWGIACFFTAQILINPIAHSHYPDTHTKRFPFKWLPVEMTLVNNFPTNTNPWAFRQTVGIQPDIGWLHFLDGNFLGRSRDLREKGFWTRGSEKAEMILKTYYPVRELVFQVLNNPRPSNRITVQVGGQKKAVTLGSRQRATLTFSQLKAFRIESLYLFKIKVKADKDSIPSFESGGSSDRRHLGVYFELEIIPEK